MVEAHRDGSSVHVPVAPTIEADVRTESDKMCWSTFVSFTLLTTAFAAMLTYNQWSLRWGDPIRMYTFEFFLTCMIGGALSGAVPHTLLTPVDVIKCRVQTGEYANFSEGFHHIHHVEARSSWLLSAPLFLRGWAPTFIGYALQGSMKFGLYEVFKYIFDGTIFSHEFASAHKVTVYLLASCCAELVADVELAPWEAVKVKMQTTRTYPPRLNIVVPRMWAAEGIHAFYKGLSPLWARQVPYTMMKFASFEKIIELLYYLLVPGPKALAPKSVQILLSLITGFISGVLCAAVSHPADTVVSKLNQQTSKASNVFAFAASLSCKDLWKGLLPRMFMIGTLTAIQWVIYDSFKVFVGLPTTGGGAKLPALDPQVPLVE